MHLNYRPQANILTRRLPRARGTGTALVVQIDIPGIRASAVSLGIRPAARIAAKHLPPDEAKRFEERIAKRATREGWEVARVAVMSTVSTPLPTGNRKGHTGGQSQAKPLSMPVLSGAETQAESNADHSKRTRYAGLEYAALTVEAAARHAREKPLAALALAPLVKQSLQGAAVAGDWQAAAGAGTVGVAIQVNIG